MGDARVVLTTLINENLLTPGPKKLYVSYYRKRVYADLLSDGSIRFKDQVYTSPVPCALHMKRTLNPSLKSDAGWSSMYSTTSGKSLKDIKDRLNLHKRGTNARSIQKDKKAATSLSLSSSSTVNDRVGQVVAATIKNKKCTACKEEATSDVAECSACHSKTHWKCASPVLEAAPLTSWFCEKCLTGQADRILEFLQQTRRVLVERIAEQKEAEDTAKDKKALAATETIEEKEHEVKEDKTATLIEVVKEEDDRSAKNDEKSLSEDKITKDVAEAEVDSVVVVSEDKEPEDGNCDGASVTAGSSSGPPTEPIVASKTMASEVVEDEGGTPGDEQKDITPDALEEKERKHEDLDPTTDVAGAKERETLSSKNQDNVTEDENIDSQQFIITEITQTPSAEEQLLVLIDGLIAEVSSKNDRTNLIANTTGAMLVHLEKTQLVQLMDYGKREILAAIQPESEEDKEQEGGDAEDDQDGSASCNNSEVGSLIKIFDLRHQILSSQSQFERTTSTLAKRTQIDICNAETRIMELEEFRTLETRAITKVVDLVNQYSNDLEECKQKKYYNEMLLESINHRRSFIRSRNINDCFVPSYRYCTKRMTTSSDQLLMTVLLEKLRDITKSVNEWTKMERHFTKMTLNLKKSLSFIGTKRKRADDVVKLLPSSASFTKFKLPPSRRLIERQIANCEANLNSIRQERVQMSRTLFGVLRIAREEQFSKEIIRMIDILYRKCRDIKAEEEEEQSRLKEEAEIVAKASEEENAVRGRENIEDSEAKKPEIETQCVDEASNACDSSSASHTNSAAAVAINVTLSSEMKGISSLLRSEDSDAKDPSYNSADTKSQADNDEDSEGDLEQASRAIADITSSVLPDIGRGDSRTELLNASLLTETPGENSLQVFTSPSQFMIRGERGNSDTRDALAHQSIAQHQNLSATRPTGRNQQSFLDQALDVLNKQQHLEHQQRLEHQHQLEQQPMQLDEQQHQLERQRQLEQQRFLEQQRLEKQHQERERQEWERQGREHQESKCLEKQQRLEQHIDRQCHGPEQWEQQRRERQQLDQEHHEEQLVEQQRIDEQRRLEEQHLLEQQRLEKQQRLVQQQRLEHQKQLLEQQRLEQQCLEQQRLDQQRLEQQRLEQQRLEQQRLEQQRLEQQRLEQQRLEQQRQGTHRRQEQQRKEKQRQQQEQKRQFQHSKPPSLPQVVPPGPSHLQMLSQQQQQQQLRQQQAALQQQQHSRQLHHPLYGDISKGMLMSSGMGANQQDVYVQQAAQMGMDMHDVARHHDLSHFVGNASGSLRGGPYMTSNEVSRNAAQHPAPTAPRTSYYGDDGQVGQLHSHAVFGSQNLSGQHRQLSDHHMFTNELQQQQPDQARSTGNQDFIIGRSYRDLISDSLQHPGVMDQSDGNDVNMGDWGQ